MAWSVSSTFGIRNGWGLLYCPTPNEVTRRIPPFGFWTRNDSGINLFRFSQDTPCLKLITLFLQFCHLLVIVLWDSAFSLRRQHCFWVVTIGHNHTTTNYDLIFHWSYSNIIFLHEGHASWYFNIQVFHHKGTELERLLTTWYIYHGFPHNFQWGDTIGLPVHLVKLVLWASEVEKLLMPSPC